MRYFAGRSHVLVPDCLANIGLQGSMAGATFTAAAVAAHSDWSPASSASRDPVAEHHARGGAGPSAEVVAKLAPIGGFGPTDESSDSAAAKKGLSGWIALRAIKVRRLALIGCRGEL